MKKLLLFFLFSFSIFINFSQTIIDENFSSGLNGWVPTNNAQNWISSNSNYAGGSAPELKLSNSPSFNALSRFVSPNYDTTGYSTLIMTFKHALNHYSGSFVVGVATRANNGSWHTVWYMSGADVIESKTLTISNADVGQDNFQVCLFFTSNTDNLVSWYFDDIKLYVPVNKDLSLLSIDNPSIISAGDNNLNIKYKNYGSANINSFDANYQINGGSIVTETVNGLDVIFGQEGTYSFTTPFNAVIGENIANVWLSNINGAGDDDIMDNNSLAKTLSVPIATVAKMPLYEEFTSSTCSPCASFNGSVFNSFMNSHTSTINVVKYQMNWPSPGDPYYTSEGGTRRAYYGVSGVPDLFVGGQNTDTSSSGVNSSFTTESNEIAYFSIQASHQLLGNVFKVDITITPYVSGIYTLHTAVIENLTTGNIGNNGETSFKNVMMKMLPNANGQTINLTAGTDYTINFSHDMSSTNVEQLNDLKAVVFIQNPASKKVHQSAYSSQSNLGNNDFVDNIVIYPNPSNGDLFINNEVPLDIEIYDMLGKKVYFSKMNSGTNNLNVDFLVNGVYNVSVSDGKSFHNHKIIISK